VAAAGIALLSSVLLSVVWGLGDVKVRTPEGFIILEDLPHDATVIVDEKKASVNWPGGSGPAEITVAPGEHTIQVKKDGLTMRGQTVTIEAGGKKVLTVRLEPPGDSRPGKIDPPTAEPSPDRAVPQNAERTQFIVLAGVWDRNGNELIQTDASKRASVITFGDDRWTDCDFAVDFMRENGTGSVGLCFRSTDENKAYVGFSMFEDRDCDVIDHNHGFEHRLKSANARIVNREWYTALVHIRGDRFVCSLYDQRFGRSSQPVEFSDQRHSGGRVGLETFGSSVRFKNIKVTSPDGRVLWEGLPAVVSATPLETSKRADQVHESARGPDGFVPLFNGLDLTGWKPHPSQRGNWHVEKGILVGSGPAAVSHLYTVRDDYKDFHLRAEARIYDAGNSGVYFRAPFGPTFPGE
jgi:eukaryotic-like serine/threonine-protein kinase